MSDPINGYTLWNHAAGYYDSWGKQYWRCRCGYSGIVNTEREAEKAIAQHQRDMEKQDAPVVAVLQRTKHIRRLFDL